MQNQAIATIDCHFHNLPLRVAAYLLQDDRQAAFIDNNTSNALPYLLKALQQEGLKPEHVRYIIVTHVHLDHSAGTPALAQACPNAIILAHPKAAPHLIDPTRLVASSREIYGEKAFKQLFGKIDPIPKERVRIVADEEVIQLGERPLRFLHTRGHANHHFCIYDSSSESIFTGDSFGVSYPDFQSANLKSKDDERAAGNTENNSQSNTPESNTQESYSQAEDAILIYPSTAPTQFHAEEARKSIRRIVATGARYAYLTHFGPVQQIKEAAELLLKDLDVIEAIINEASKLPQQEIPSFCKAKAEQFLYDKLRAMGIDPASKKDALKQDILINSSGITYAAAKQQKIAANSS